MRDAGGGPAGGEPAAGADGIEPGRRLVRSIAPALSLGQRLVEIVERLTWRTAIHDRRLAGQHPPKLIAVPHDPHAGDPAAGEAVLAGGLPGDASIGIADAIDAAGPLPPDALMYAQSFAWLRDLAAVRDRSRTVPAAEALAAHWLAIHGERVSDVAWRPGLWGRRLLLWTAHAPLLLSSTDLVFRSAVLNAIARGARHLDRTAPRAPVGVERVAAWCGVVAAGLLIPGGTARLALGEAGLERALAEALTGDGGIASRAPTALLEVIGLLGMLRAVYDARRMELPPTVAARLSRAVPALLGTTMGDGGLSSWQGGAPLRADRVRAIIAASGVTGRPLRQARDWGYQRLVASGTVLVMDAAPPPATQVADGGCASTLAFELADGPERLIVNCGGARAVEGRLPASAVTGLRSTAAHSTLTLADSNSTAIHPDGTLGRGVAEVSLARQESEAGSRIEASHDGYVRRHGLLHRRQLVLIADGRELRGEDVLFPSPSTPAWRAARRGAVPFALRFHLGAGVEASTTVDGLAAMLRLPSGAIWQFRSRSDPLTVEDSLWVDPDGRAIATQQIVVAGLAASGGATIGWALKRAR